MTSVLLLLPAGVKVSSIFTFTRTNMNDTVVVSLWVFMGVMDVYGCLWVFGRLCVPMGVYECLWVFMDVYEFLWVFMGIYGFLWVYGYLWVSWVSMGVYGSL